MEGEYLAAINRTGRTTLGASESTLLGIVAAVSRLAPARALLDHRQARFTPRLLARPQGHGGPEEIMSRQGADPTERLRGATHLRLGELGGKVELARSATFPGRIVKEEEEENPRDRQRGPAPCGRTDRAWTTEKWGRRWWGGRRPARRNPRLGQEEPPTALMGRTWEEGERETPL